MSVNKILKQNKFFSYKMRLGHELNKDDFDHRIQFYETIMAKIDTELDFLSNVVFSNETTFQLNSTVNRHNCRLWSDTNLHWMREHAISIEIERLDREIEWQINRTILYWKRLDSSEIWRHAEKSNCSCNQHDRWWKFSTDVISSTAGQNVRNYLDTIFSERWIRRRDTSNQLDHHLISLDFFLWSYLKNWIYRVTNGNVLKVNSYISPPRFR